MNISETQEDGTDSRSGLAYVWVAGTLAFLTSVPALFARGLVGDDWTVYYAYWTEGAASVARMMWQVAHGGYAVPMEIFVSLGQATPNVAARIIGLSCHLLSGALLYRALSSSPYTRAIAALTTALFLLSPFYAIRLTLNAVYDFFLVFYLLSYVLMNSRSRVLRWIAPLSLFFSLSLETLMALEPLRLLLAYRAGERWTAWLARLIPFWVAIAVVIVLRLTIMGKSGHYENQYLPVHNIGVVKAALSAHLRAFPRALSYAYEYGFAFLGHRVSAVLVLAVIAGFALLGSRLFRTTWLLKSSAHTTLLILLGVTVTLLGALPYALVGIYGDVTRAESRLLFPSQFGVLLLLATAIQCVPPSRLRAAIAGGAIAVFALSMAHDSKWLLYDGLVTSDLQRQTRAALLADPGPKLVELKIQTNVPLFFRGRCLGANDMNAAQTILRDDRTPQNFIYTDTCGDFTNPDIVPHGVCPVSYLDSFPCPQRREIWLYRPAPGIAALDDISMVDLMAAVLSRSSTATGGLGELVKLTGEQPSPLARAEYRPPCRRVGVQALLWLLALPVSSCEATSAGG
ncbi:hypothetical protein [Bradyrhizobium canariense]|uniref:Glycosyltransferase RgtA/B/C/D-like domain-containing protein n=1 Tax=Bradyrhizobium canariense TaxID=255045 RepID=A0A1H1QFP8_9BRAD|nr:hypothetical protein [Bradyrhizobium canariense]SDS22236.1 hypothetical protein SAMN05444158_1391 [Bradyrhizobium canariense]